MQAVRSGRFASFAPSLRERRCWSGISIASPPSCLEPKAGGIRQWAEQKERRGVERAAFARAHNVESSTASKSRRRRSGSTCLRWRRRSMSCAAVGPRRGDGRSSATATPSLVQGATDRVLAADMSYQLQGPSSCIHQKSAARALIAAPCATKPCAHASRLVCSYACGLQ